MSDQIMETKDFQNDPLKSIPDAMPSNIHDITKRFKNIAIKPAEISTLFANEPVGSTRNFWGLDVRSPKYFQFKATVVYSSKNAVWYFPSPSIKQLPEISELVTEFENVIWPETIRFFTPGLELPGKIAIIHGSFPRLGGYFQASDILPLSINPYSNQRMGIYLNEPENLMDPSYLGTLTHELQHLFHWHFDKNEEVWLQEGLSELAARRLNYQALPFSSFLKAPNVSLTKWPSSPGKSLPNYASASLFAGYLNEKLMARGIALLVANPSNGFTGIDNVLKLMDRKETSIDLFHDWLISNYLNSSSEQYTYDYLEKTVSPNMVITKPGEFTESVSQYGAWYTEILNSDDLLISFSGAPATAILPILPYSGEYCWWSNRGNSINSQLTRSFDLRNLNTASLNFKAWWDIEKQWDHGYVTVSTNLGRNWQILKGNWSSTDNPLGTSLGPSYTGQSGKWRNINMDLTPFVGNNILLRFEYITDESIDTPGWCLDDVKIKELGFFDNFEQADDAWEPNGFVKNTSRGVKQDFALFYVNEDNHVSEFTLNKNNKVTFSTDNSGTLIITASAPKTSEPAYFNLTIESTP